MTAYPPARDTRHRLRGQSGMGGGAKDKVGGLRGENMHGDTTLVVEISLVRSHPAYLYSQQHTYEPNIAQCRGDGGRVKRDMGQSDQHPPFSERMWK